MDFKVYLERQKTQNNQLNFEREQSHKIDATWLQDLLYKAIIIKTIRYWWKQTKRSIEQIIWMDFQMSNQFGILGINPIEQIYLPKIDSHEYG